MSADVNKLAELLRSMAESLDGVEYVSKESATEAQPDLLVTAEDVDRWIELNGIGDLERTVLAEALVEYDEDEVISALQNSGTTVLTNKDEIESYLSEAKDKIDYALSELEA